MQYILTQAEMDALTPVNLLTSYENALEDARKMIIKLAGVPCGKTYCGECPISDVGYYNHDDPEAISRESSRLICVSGRHYGK